MKDVQKIYSVSKTWNKDTGALDKHRTLLGNIALTEESYIPVELYRLIEQEAKKQKLNLDFETEDGRKPQLNVVNLSNWISFE